MIPPVRLVRLVPTAPLVVNVEPAPMSMTPELFGNVVLLVLIVPPLAACNVPVLVKPVGLMVRV